MHQLHFEIRFGFPLSGRNFIPLSEVLANNKGLLLIPFSTAAVRKSSSRSFSLVHEDSFLNSWLMNFNSRC